MISIRSVIRRRLCVLPILFGLLIPITVFGQQSDTSNVRLTLTPFIGIGTNNGKFEHSIPDLDYIQPFPMRNERIWYLDPGYIFTLKLLLEKTSQSKNERYDIITLGLLVGTDLSLIPNRIDRIEGYEVPIPGQINDRFFQNVVYIGPTLAFGLRFIPVRLLFTVGPNYTFWDKSNLHGLDIENCAGLSFLSIVRHGSLWSGISIHHNSTEAIKETNIYPAPDYIIDFSSNVVWLYIGYCGW